MISENLQSFQGKPVKDYTAGAALEPDKYVYRLRLEYDSEFSISSLLDSFVSDPASANVKELIIGMFSGDYSDNSEEAVNQLVEWKDSLKQLSALFIGDMVAEECEISWIQQSDIGPLLEAYPSLEYLQVRGGEGLSFSNLQHDKLSTLIIETGGLPPNVVKEVNEARLPNLSTLHLWLGSDNYGFESRADDFQGIFSGRNFPKLTHLGLMNSEIQDEIAKAICKAPILKQLKVLDLSMGTLTDEGGEALLNCKDLGHLEHLNLRRHYLSEEMMEKLASLGISINLDDRETDDEYRYAEVTE